MNRLANLYKSSIGKKFIAAVTGLILFGFLIGHAAGNLKIFTGTTAMTSDGTEYHIPHVDEYGRFLREAGVPLIPEKFALWGVRLVLLGALVLHVLTVMQLAAQSKSARPTSYVKSRKSAASLPALYMMFTGLILLAFIVFHILHLTTGTIVFGGFEHGYVYNNLSQSFRQWPVAIGYVLVMAVLAFHLYHGVWSLFQTLGLDNPDRNGLLRLIAVISAVGLFIGFSVVPLAFLSGGMTESYEYLHELLTKH